MKRIIIAALVTALSGAPLLAAPQGFAVHETPKDVPAVVFADGEGRRTTLDDFGGRTIILNVWATWCPPCIEEMPTLDALQSALGGEGFEVVALSVDRAGPEVVRKFFEKTGVAYLDLYIDDTMKSAAALGAFGLPLTLLIDPEGREVGRLVGPAEWDAPDMIEFLRGFIPGDVEKASAAPRRSVWKARTP